ncbi:lipoprotein releasing system ATP-binding protein LolD [Klebsiella pneumoniae]|uniref:Lipoprotein releasing system ATP-binding protein LolD n=1 Tax=Klebsiella pneumoniae TaxID=573 RepID=A0A4P0Y5N0_KLEPN|nr:lipoprotein releasing system ATP-binding protein LolD [Klebsiella pneumoniae]
MNKILLQCDNLCKRYQEGNVQPMSCTMSASALVKAR